MNPPTLEPAMIELHTPRGLKVDVPERADEDPSPKFALADAAAIRQYYADNGYVVLRELLPTRDCHNIRGLWEREVKPSRDFIYRQATARAERHVFNAQGWVMNPILNLQSVDPGRYPRFRDYATDRILTARPLAEAFELILGERPKIVQSMYFEGNSATWEHQDSYYLDSEKLGCMAGAWIALEDIGASAGRFFICPQSHRIDLGRQGLHNHIADHHDLYIRSVVRKVEELGLPIRAPRLCQGDVLLWNSRTIHGSLDSQDARCSRSSITCHGIPDSHRFLQLQTRIKPLQIRTINGVRVHCPKDLARMRNRAILYLETRHSKAFHLAKRTGIRWLFRLKGAH
ncbi:MAG TPA: phytanoyl-CoA dioxygenase family protein [Steroidobacteraceae bacterium]|nr:phytanoyl-CoA dioxygenase family protein [Steroidobacteraceae bacterium]